MKYYKVLSGNLKDRIVKINKQNKLAIYHSSLGFWGKQVLENTMEKDQLRPLTKLELLFLNKKH